MAARNQEETLSIREQLELAQLEEILEKKQVKQAKIDRDKAVQASVVASVKEADRRQKLKEQHCQHTKENSNKTNLGGVRDSANVLYFICQNCGKDFTMETCPPHLYPEAMKIGGPIFGSSI